MKIKALSLLMAICMVVSLFPAVTAVEHTEAPVPGSGVQEHIHEIEPVLPQAEKAPDAEPEAAPALPLGIEDYPALTYGEEITIEEPGIGDRSFRFTPETSGTYRFYSVAPIDVNAWFYNAAGEMLAYGAWDCYDRSHGHPMDKNFCIIVELEAGLSYELAVRAAEECDSMAIGVSCAHDCSAYIDPETDELVYDCAKCDHIYTTEANALSYDGERTVSMGMVDYPYATFTPEVTGTYRFYGVGEVSQACSLMDANLEYIVHAHTDCDNPFHRHSEGEQFCLIAELEGGTTYLLDIYSEAETMRIGVTCGHSVTIESVDDSGCVSLTCRSCGAAWNTQCGVLNMGEDYEIEHAGGNQRDTYLMFTAEHSGNYRFYSSGGVAPWARLFDTELKALTYYFDSCKHYDSPHTGDDEFCDSQWLEAGETVVLVVRNYAEFDEKFAVHVECMHEFTREYSPETGLISNICSYCGETITEECPRLEYDKEITLPCSSDTSTYATFTPERSGSYRFYSVGDRDTYARLHDAQMNQIARNDDCYDRSHGHPGSSNFCIIRELEAGTTYVLSVEFYSDDSGNVTIGVGCGHNFAGEVIREATCAEPGITRYTCTVCGYSYDEEVTVDHNYISAVTKEATCTEPGIRTYTCTVCGYSYDEEVTVDHNYFAEVTKKATCAEPGIRTYTCTMCGHSYTEEITVDHCYVSEITEEGTCAEPGTIVHTCAVCGHTETKDYKTRHSYESRVIKEATCTEDGLERYTCTVCGDSYDRDIWSRHDYQKESIPGTCTQTGYDVYTCTKCGYSYTDEESGWYEHDYEEAVTTEPTCTEPGWMEERCTLCGYVNHSYEIDPLGHGYNADLICTRCGEAAPATWGDLNWTYEDGVLTITGEGEMPELEFIEAWDDFWIDNTPWKDLPVREAVIGEGITNVTAALFENREELQKVTLPSTLTEIGSVAFHGCSALTAVDLPEGLTTIGYDAFYGCALTEIVLPESLTEVGRNAFGSCDLREVHVPAGLLDRYSDRGYYERCDWFDGNWNLKRISVDENNPRMCADDQGVLYSKDMSELLLIPYGIEGTYVLPASVTALNDSFYDCAKLDTIEVAAGNPGYFSRNGMLYTGDLYDYYWDDNGNTIYVHHENVLIACPPARELGDHTIDAQTGGLGQYAFRNCTKLTGLTIPKTCTINPYHDSSVGFRNIVSGCSALAAVRFEEGHPECFNDENGFVYNAKDRGVVLVGEFKAGTVLEYVPAVGIGPYLEIPEGVEAVDAYLESPELRAIRFPSTLRGFGNYVLTDCTLDWMLFTGDEPIDVSMEETDWASGVTAKVYYPNWLESWDSFYLDVMNCDLTYIPYAQGQEPVWGGEGNPFTDVPVGSFYAEPVLWAVENNITTGASENSFNPNGQCLRAQVVTFLWRAEGCPEPESLSNPFVDIKESDFYFKAVLWAVEKGITNGSDATHFNPFGVCNRAQVVTFLHRAKGSPAPASMELPFTDVPAGTWYAAPIAWAVEKGITNGLSATAFGPNAACNRAQVVTFLYRAYV